MWPGFHENQGSDLDKVCGFLTLPQQMRYHGNRMSDFKNSSLFVEKFLENQF